MPAAEFAFDLAKLERAAALVHRSMLPTPQFQWPKLSRRAGCTVWVKHENHTPTGAFKVRGGLVYLDRLQKSAAAPAGVITATRGNHGQSIAYSAARAGVPATIYVPLGNSPDQNRSIADWGARVVEFGRDFDTARHEAFRVAEAEKLHFVPSFHPDLVIGVASYALELFRAAGELDAVYVGVGMGSGICGLIMVRDLLGLKTEIVGVVAANAPAFALSVEAGHPVRTDTAQTFADGLACRDPQAEALEIIAAGAARVVTVSEDAMAEAIRIYYVTTHNLAEGAGAAPLAALLQERDRNAGKRIGLILTGGNIDMPVFARILRGETPGS